MPRLSAARYILAPCKADLPDKMVFVGGPRQVGKTTFALHLLGAKPAATPHGYLNWDIDAHRKQILTGEIPSNAKLVVFDEIHKFARWRALMKGFYDQYYPKRQALVTGSARLDYYRKGGDSLQGRYHYYRLHPYSLRELSTTPSPADLSSLLKFGGFPEPLKKQNSTHWRRWQIERMTRVLRNDLTSLERVAEISLLELLMEALPHRVGAPLSLQNIREDLAVSHDSVRRWLEIFENLYLVFRIAPYGAPRIRAVKKEQKLYLWDWSAVPDPGSRFENIVASQLLKFCHFEQDTKGYRMELRYLRDTDKREVDFVVLRDKRPLFAVECKLTDTTISPASRYFRERTNIPKFYQVHMGSKDYGDEDTQVRVMPFTTFVKELSLP